jgi:hypothetical protein
MMGMCVAESVDQRPIGHGSAAEEASATQDGAFFPRHPPAIDPVRNRPAHDERQDQSIKTPGRPGCRMARIDREFIPRGPEQKRRRRIDGCFSDGRRSERGSAGRQGAARSSGRRHVHASAMARPAAATSSRMAVSMAATPASSMRPPPSRRWRQSAMGSGVSRREGMRRPASRAWPA